MNRIIRIAAALAFAATPALADLQPTAAELAGVESSLFDRGYQGWERIKLHDDGEWEIERAVGADGVSYDLRIDYDTLEITRKNRNILQWDWNR